jgi:hypothetical protein
MALNFLLCFDIVRKCLIHSKKEKERHKLAGRAVYEANKRVLELEVELKKYKGDDPFRSPAPKVAEDPPPKPRPSIPAGAPLPLALAVVADYMQAVTKEAGKRRTKLNDTVKKAKRQVEARRNMLAEASDGKIGRAPKKAGCPDAS